MQLLKTAVLVSGGGSNLQAIIDARPSLNINLDVVISNRKAAYGLKRAEDAGIDAVYIKGTDPQFEEKLLAELENRGIELIVLAGFLKILSPDFVEKFPNKIMNIHPSLLPSFGGNGFYGMHVHEAVFAKGCKVSGCTTHFVDARTDTGPIIMQYACDISQLTSPEDIQRKVLKYEHKLIVETIRLISNNLIYLEDNAVRLRKEL